RDASRAAWRKSVPVPPIEVRASLLAQLLDQDLVEVVRPRPRRLGQLRLDRGDVEIAGRAPIGAYDYVESSQYRLGDARAEVDACTFECHLEGPLDASTDAGVVPLEWEKDETRQETAERVAPDEEPNPATLPEVQDPERDVIELVLLDLEELVAGIALEDLDERLAVVTAGDESAALDN